MCGSGVGLGAHADVLTHLAGVQVVVHQAVNDLGEVVLNDGVADLLQEGIKREQRAELEIYSYLFYYGLKLQNSHSPQTG